MKWCPAGPLCPLGDIAWTRHSLICPIVFLVALTLAGCATSHPMMPTPVLYAGPQAKPLFTHVPAERRTPPLDVLFITDRAPATSAEGGASVHVGPVALTSVRLRDD